MEKIPTAEEILQKHVPNRYTKENSWKNAMIEFAKLHVEAALKVASEGQINKDIYMIIEYGENMDWKSSILNSYPLENIK